VCAGAAPTVIGPSCADPAPISNSFDPKASGYIVMLKSGTSAEREAIRLSKIPGVSVTFLFQGRSPMVSGDISPTALATLRCDRNVRSVSYVTSTSIAWSMPSNNRLEPLRHE